MGYVYVFCEDFKFFSFEGLVICVFLESQCKLSRGDENNIIYYKIKNVFGFVLNFFNYIEMFYIDKCLMYYIIGCKEF